MTPQSCRPGLPPASTTTATTSQTTIPAPPTPPTCSIKSSRRGRTFTCWPATSPTRIRPDWASPQPSCRRPPTPRRVSTSSIPTSGTCTSGPSRPAPQQHHGCSPPATTTWRPRTRPTATVDIWPGWTFPATAPPPARRCTRSSTAMSPCCPWTPTTSATKSKPTPATRAAAKTPGLHAHWLRTAPTPTSTSSCVSSTTARTPPPRRTPATAECGQPGVICSTATRSTWYSRVTTMCSNARTPSGPTDRPRSPPTTRSSTPRPTARCTTPWGAQDGRASPSNQASWKATAEVNSQTPSCLTATSGPRAATGTRKRSAGRGCGSPTTPSSVSTCDRAPSSARWMWWPSTNTAGNSTNSPTAVRPAPDPSVTQCSLAPGPSRRPRTIASESVQVSRISRKSLLARSSERAVDDDHRVAGEVHAVAVDRAAHEAAAGRDLQGGEVVATKALRPERRERRVGAASDRVLGDAVGRSEEARHEVVAAARVGVRRGHDGAADTVAAGNADDRAEVRGDGADGRLVVEQCDEVAEGAGRVRRPWGGAERFYEAFGRADLGRRRGGEVERDRPVVGAVGDEDAAAAREADCARRTAVTVHRVGGRERRVAAEVRLDLRREPAQRPVGLAAVAERMGERRVREIHLRGHLLHPRFVGPRVGIVEQADGSGVAAERPVGERIDDPDPHGPTLGPCRSGNIEELRHHGAGDAVPLAMFGAAQNPDYWRAADELGSAATPAQPL